MARSEDPTTYSQAWQDAQQGYAAVDPLTQQQPQPVYDTQQHGYASPQPGTADPYAQPQDAYAQATDPYAQPQDPYAQPVDPYAQPADPYAQPVTQPAGYAQPVEYNTYADQQPATAQYAQQHAEAYPPLELSTPAYDTVPGAQTYQQPAAADPYATYDQQAAQQPQAYQEPQTYQSAAPQGYEQPVAYQPLDPVTQPTQEYAAPPMPEQTYVDTAQVHAQAQETGYEQQQPSVVYADYAAPQAAPHDPYAAPQAHDPYAAQQPAQYGGQEPLAPAVPASTYSDFAHQQEPVLGDPQQDYAGQPQYQTEQHYQPELHAQAPAEPEPHVQDPFAYPQPGAQYQRGAADDGFLDPGMFAQPEPAPQTGGFGTAALGGAAFDNLGQPAQQQHEPQFGGQAGYQQPTGYDQRFDPQTAGYDQRFEQPVQSHYDGGPVGDLGLQNGFDDQTNAGTEIAPVIAEQQVAPSRSRRGLIVVGALVAAVGIGGALGFAYKYSNDSSNSASANPPTIKASRTAAKQTPKATAGQNTTFSNQLQTNRAASKSTTRVVSREEPLGGQQGDLKLRTRTSGQTTPTSGIVKSIGEGAKKVAGVRRVKTLKVNPDGSFALPTTAAGFGNSENVISGATIGGSLPTAKPVKAKRISVPKALNAAKKKVQKTAASLPKLTAQIPEPQPVKKPRKKVAKLQLPKSAVSAGGLGYVVQVSARRSRIDALAAFADLQQRYTSALSSKQPDIQEVNLGGTRGKWYRVRIGPPGSKNAAYNLCNRLKKSGLKDCLIKAY